MGGQSTVPLVPSLSACMIVRDEAAGLERCLMSLMGVPGQIVIVDTGSTDGSRDVARRHGAVLIDSTWQDDFSAARNASLDAATGDWILVIDADEELAADSAALLPSLLQRGEVEGYFCEIVDYLGERSGKERAVSIGLRLFRNRPEHRYERRVHEQIEPAILRRNPAARRERCGVRLLHHGYLRPNVERKGKRNRNLRLLEREAAEGGDAFTYFNLGCEYLRLDRLEEALAALDQALARGGEGLVYICEAHLRKLICLQRLGRLEEALACAEQARQRFPDHVDLWFMAGELLHGLGRRAEAIRMYERCLELGESQGPFTSLVGVGSFRACHNLGLLYHELGDDGEARRRLLQALRFDPAGVDSVRLLAENLARAGDPWPALAELIPAGDVNAGHLVASILFDLCLPHRALPLIAPGSPGHMAALRVLCLMATGKVALAAREAKAALEAEPDNPRVAAAGCIVAWYRNKPAEAARCLAVLGAHPESRAYAAFHAAWAAPTPAAVVPDDPSRPPLPAILSLLFTFLRCGCLGLLKTGLTLLHPSDDLSVWLQLGKAYHAAGCYAEARTELADCLARGHTDVEALLILADIAQAVGEAAEAQRHLEHALKLEPAHAGAALRLAALHRRLAKAVLLGCLAARPESRSVHAALAALKGG